ncbi:pyridoxal-phosphate dependent enzyme [Streptomyces sp. NPDC059477]|uniref:pyridoxal-phosphate dependent enzyme n=1 Tax=Streptomyces sp. NPDC059477 TaxID=3346847 RepID=UPI00369B33AA
MAHEHGEKSPSVWAGRAIDLLLADRAAEPPTPLDLVPLPDLPRARVYLKDESRRPSGSGAHGPARDLLLDALREGRIDRDTPLFDAASGDLAVAQAYFAWLLGLPYTAVVPASADPAEVRAIERRGGRCRTAEPPLGDHESARELAERAGGHFLDHRHRLADALDWDGPYSLGAEILDAVPSAWIVMEDGVCAASVGRHLRARTASGTRLAVTTRPRTAPQAAADLTLPAPDGTRLGGARQVLDRMRRDGTEGAGAVVVVIAR